MDIAIPKKNMPKKGYRRKAMIHFKNILMLNKLMLWAEVVCFEAMQDGGGVQDVCWGKRS